MILLSLPFCVKHITPLERPKYITVLIQMYTKSLPYLDVISLCNNLSCWWLKTQDKSSLVKNILRFWNSEFHWTLDTCVNDIFFYLFSAFKLATFNSSSVLWSLAFRFEGKKSKNLVRHLWDNPSLTGTAQMIVKTKKLQVIPSSLSIFIHSSYN